MRYKIKRLYDQRPPTALTTERNPVIVAQWRALGQREAARREGRFAPLRWPGTRQDVAWSSSPTFGRAPQGWHRQGFFA